MDWDNGPGFQGDDLFNLSGVNIIVRPNIGKNSTAAVTIIPMVA